MIEHRDIFFDLDSASPPASGDPTPEAPARTPEQVAASAARMRAKVREALGPYGVPKPPAAPTESELFAAHETAVVEAAAAIREARERRLLAWRMGHALDL